MFATHNLPFPPPPSCKFSDISHLRALRLEKKRQVCSISWQLESHRTPELERKWGPGGQLCQGLLKPASPSTHTVLQPGRSPGPRAGQHQNTWNISKANKFLECKHRATKESQTRTERWPALPQLSSHVRVHTSYPRHRGDRLPSRSPPMRAPPPTHGTPPCTPPAPRRWVQPRCRCPPGAPSPAGQQLRLQMPPPPAAGGSAPSISSAGLGQGGSQPPQTPLSSSSAASPQSPPRRRRRRKLHGRRQLSRGKEGTCKHGPAEQGQVPGCRESSGKGPPKAEGVRGVQGLRSGCRGTSGLRARGVSRLGWGEGAVSEC